MEVIKIAVPAQDYSVEYIYSKYGNDFRILSRKERKKGGFLGFFQKDYIEINGYYPTRSPYVKRGTVDEERAKILQIHGDPLIAQRIKKSTPKDGANVDYLNIADHITENIKRNLREEIQTQFQHVQPVSHTNIAKIKELLEENDFSKAYIQELILQVQETFTVGEMDDFRNVALQVRQWITENIHVYPWKENNVRVLSLVGPTGVGKTTTIAKLAAWYSVRKEVKRDVKLLTTDGYRLGAVTQLQKFGEIMNVPVILVERAIDIRKHIAVSQENDFIFIDTSGTGPHDVHKHTMNKTLTRAVEGEIHLTISAAAALPSLRSVFRRFNGFDCNAVVVTKLDEAERIGNILSILKETQKFVSFITDGQNVPEDLQRVTPELFLQKLHGFPSDDTKSESDI